jgi:hypothetical protein
MRREPPTTEEKAWNPYSWRLREIAALGDHPTSTARVRQLAEEVLAAEALELAQGIRHASIVHGDPTTIREADQVDTFLGQIPELLDGATWSRCRGDYEHIIVAAGGDDAAERIDHVAGLAELTNPGHWRITDSARPDLNP